MSEIYKYWKLNTDICEISTDDPGKFADYLLNAHYGIARDLIALGCEYETPKDDPKYIWELIADGYFKDMDERDLVIWGLGYLRGDFLEMGREGRWHGQITVEEVSDVKRYAVMSDDGQPSFDGVGIDELLARVKEWAEQNDGDDWRAGEDLVLRRVE